MLFNYVKVALRNLGKYKIFTLINITGLAIGLATCLLILQYVSFKLSFDQFNTNLDNLYRVVNDRYQAGKLIQHGTITYSGVGKALDDDYSQVIDHARIVPAGEKVIIHDDKRFSEPDVLFTDPSFLKMFSYPLLAGNKDRQLQSPHTVVITASLARKIFDSSPGDYSSLVGKSILLHSDSIPFKIDGIIDDVPENSHLKFSMLMSYTTLVNYWKEADYDFTQSDFWHYVQLAPGSDYKQINATLDKFSARHFQGSKVSGSDEKFYLQPLSRAHLYSDFEYEIGQTGNATVVWGLVVIALFIISIAWFNYVNLSTARSVERSREVGIRKVIGSSRKQLIAQFMCESSLVNVISIAVALLIVISVQPSFNKLLQYNLSMSYLFTKGFNGYAILISFAILVTAGIILSGFYPAFVLSSFKPIHVLKGKVQNSKNGVALRKGLVVVQFSITIGLMIGSIVSIRQINYMSSTELGFNMDQMLIVKPPILTRWDSTFITRVNSFKAEVTKIPRVTGIASSWNVPGGDLGRSFNVHRAASSTNEKYTMRQTGVDYDFLPLYKVDLLAGRYFSLSDHNPDWSKLHNAIINRSATKMLGFRSPQDAVGKSFYSGEKKWDIVGVVEDYHQKSLKFPLEPIRFMPAYSTNSTISVKVSADNVEQTIAAVKKQYDAFFPGNVFAYSFLDDDFKRQYDNEQLFAKVFAIFAALAIMVACLGMFGLAMFATLQRTKEIGVRKVLGASVSSILILVSKDFVRLIVLAIIIACPIAWWVMNGWLQDFSYRINISWWIFVIVAGGAIVLALITVSIQALKSALTNPVTSLRAE